MVLTKYLTERQIKRIGQHKSVGIKVDGAYVIFKPKPKDLKVIRKIEKYKERIKELQHKLKPKGRKVIKD